MAAQPIGVSFMPTDESAQMGPKRNQLEGAGGSDLAQAFKILSLHLPRVLGAQAIAPQRLLNSQGARGIPAAFSGGGESGSPSVYGAFFESLLKSMNGAGSYAPMGAMGAGMGLPPSSFDAHVSAGNEGHRGEPVADMPPIAPPAFDSRNTRLADIYDSGPVRQRRQN